MQSIPTIHENLSKLEQSIPVVLFQFTQYADKKLNFSYAGGNTLGLFELAPEILLQDSFSFLNLIDEKDRSSFKSAIKESAQNLTSVEWEGRLLHPSGKQNWIRMNAMPDKSPSGNISWSGMFADISDDINNRISKKKSEEFIHEMGDMAKIGAWESDFETMLTNWSDEVYSIYEIDPSVKIETIDALNNFPHSARLIIEAAIDKAARDTIPWDLELPFITAKGKELWVRSLGKALLSKDGKVTGLYGIFQDITDRKIAEETLSVIFEHSPDAHLIFDASGIIDCNNAAVKMLKYQNKEELIGIHPAKLSPEYQPDGRLSTEKAIEMDALAYKNGLHQFEWIHRKMDGEDFPVEVTLSPVRIANKLVLLLIWHDITKRKEAETNIKRSEAMLSETEELTHSGSWEFDLVTGISYWSAEAFRIFNLPFAKQGPSTTEFGDMIHPEDLENYQNALKRAIKEKIPSNIDLRIVLPSGEIKFIQAIGKPLYDTNGRVIKLYGGILDITERKANEQALTRAKEEAEQAATAKTDFLSTMSHEIRTPMNAVMGFTHLLLQNDPREDQIEYLKILKFSSDNLLVLINDILDFSKIEAGKISFEEIDFNIKDLISTTRSALQHRADEKGIQLKLMIDDDLPEMVIGDPIRLGQILNNLLTNAVKFTEEGKVTITASFVKQDLNTTTIKFEIADTGIGISTENQLNIFESFKQASSNTTRKYGGTGLGLTITKRLLELQGSQIKLESTVGQGSLFYFSLTFKRSEKQIASNATDQVVPEIKNLKGVKVLLAEDNKINILLAKQCLKQWDIVCDVAMNGAEAVALVKENDYDLVLMDLQMPEMDGFEATEQIRNMLDDKYKNLPIIALTASALLDIKGKAKDVGMNDYVSKPFNPDELYKKITDCLNQNK